jgi:SnoaL-like domain
MDGSLRTCPDSNGSKWSRCRGFRNSSAPWSWRACRPASQARPIPVGEYFTALNEGDAHALETVWPGEVVIYDPRAGEVRGHRHVRQFVSRNLSWLAGQAHPGDVVGRYQAALDAGDVDAVVSTFAPDGYFRGPFGPDHAHRGAAELRSFYTRCFSAGGGIGLQDCMVTDDGVRCAVEYNCVRWGSHDLPPQAGLGVYERGPDGLLAAARVYDDVEAPAG